MRPPSFIWPFVASCEKHSLAITKQCDASLVAAAAQHRALSAKLAELQEQSGEIDALRPKADERDAFERERDEAVAALAVECEETARLAAELAAAAARGTAAQAKERAAQVGAPLFGVLNNWFNSFLLLFLAHSFVSPIVVCFSFLLQRETEDAHIALAEAKAKVASLTERSVRELGEREAWMNRIVGACAGEQDFCDKLSGKERIAELEDRATLWEGRFMRMQDQLMEANLVLGPLGYVFVASGKLKKL